MIDHLKAINWTVVVPDAQDIVFLLGIGSLFYGLYQVYSPSAFIVVGALLVLPTWWPFMAKGKTG